MDLLHYRLEFITLSVYITLSVDFYYLIRLCSIIGHLLHYQLLQTLALRYNSGILLSIVINDKNAICCMKPVSNWKFDEYFDFSALRCSKVSS